MKDHQVAALSLLVAFIVSTARADLYGITFEKIRASAKEMEEMLNEVLGPAEVERLYNVAMAAAVSSVEG